MNRKIYLSTFALLLLVSVGVATKVFADTTNIGLKGGIRAGMGDTMMNHGGGVFGTVTAVSGNSITLTSKGFGPNKTATTYTIDATGATVMKDGVASSVSNIAVGDSISVQGTVNGTSVTATNIRDGRGAGPNNTAGLEASIPEGNGQPIIGGSVTAVSGSTITITNKSNVAYTVDVSGAKITKSGKAGTATDIVVGDTVIAQGTVNGTAVTAVNFVDQGQIKAGHGPAHKGFFGAIGSFFARLFGF